MKVTLATTEVLDGVKRRPGDVVDLPADHPVAQKTLAAEKAAAEALQPKKKADAGRD